MIWFYVAREAINNTMSTFLIPVSYSLGYATGTFLGSKLSKIIIKGVTNIIIVSDNKLLITYLRNNHYYYSKINLAVSYDHKRRYMLVINVSNRGLKTLINAIKKYDNKAFMTFSETQAIYNGYLK